MRVIWAIRADTYTYVWMDINNDHLTMTNNEDLLKHFDVLKKYKNNFDCLVHEMLFIREVKLTLKVQSESIRAKVFL